jgi:anti-sigma-K factor RskA
MSCRVVVLMVHLRCVLKRDRAQKPLAVHLEPNDAMIVVLAQSRATCSLLGKLMSDIAKIASVFQSLLCVGLEGAI